MTLISQQPGIETLTTLDEATVEALGARLRGPLIRPADADYETARRVWNGMIDKRPALIARCASIQPAARRAPNRE